MAVGPGTQASVRKVRAFRVIRIGIRSVQNILDEGEGIAVEARLGGHFARTDRTGTKLEVAFVMSG